MAWYGFNALNHGVFFGGAAKQRFEDLSIVPIACPMIAGPAMIAAVLSLGAQHGTVSTAASTTPGITCFASIG